VTRLELPPDIEAPVVRLDVFLDEQVTLDPDFSVVGTERATLHVAVNDRVAVEPCSPRHAECPIDVDLRTLADPKVAVDRAEPDPPIAGDSCLRHRPGQVPPLL